MASVINNLEVFGIAVIEELQDLEVKCCMTIHIRNSPFFDLEPILFNEISLLLALLRVLKVPS